MLLSIYPATQNSTGDAIAGVIVLLLMAIVWRVRKSPHKLSPYGMIIAIILCLAHYLFPQTGGDFNSYKDWVESSGITNVDIIAMYYMHFEKVYYIIVNFVHNDYFLFRLVVWGSSLILFCLTAMRLKLDASTFVFFLSIYVVSMTSTSRVCLAYALSFYGFSFIAKPFARKGSNILSIALGVFFVAISLLFHRSAVFLLPVLAVSILKFNKTTLSFAIIIFPIVVAVLNTNLYNYIFNTNHGEDSLIDADTAGAYLYADEKVFGIGHLVRLALLYSGFFSVAFLIVKSILNKSYMGWPKPIQKYANAILSIIILSAAFLFVSGNTYKTFERLACFSVFPISVFMAYLLKIDFEKKSVKRIIFLLAGYVVYNIIYDRLYLGG